MKIEDYYRTCQLFSSSECLDKPMIQYKLWSKLFLNWYFDLRESRPSLNKTLSHLLWCCKTLFTNGLSANPCPLHYKAESETSKLGWAWIWKFLLNLHPNLVSHEKKYISAWFEMVHIASTNGKEESTIVNVSLDILTQISLDPWCSLDMQNTAPPPPQLPCFFHPQYGRHSSWIITSLRGKLN